MASESNSAPDAPLESDDLTSTEPILLSLNNLGVDFGATRALDNISLSVRAGEVVGLVGHNGAGKSTLFNIVSGALAASRGTVEVAGVRAPAHPTPRQMAKLGVTVIHQEPALAHNLSVADNIYLAQEDLLRRGGKAEQARRALAAVGANIDVSWEVSLLSLGERQLVDLARGIAGGGARVLLLDEPTAALGREETETLHQLIRKLASEGTSVVYVSHRLPDILDVCTRVVILKAGRIQEDQPVAAFDGPSLSQALAPDVTVDPIKVREMQEGHSVALFGADEGIVANVGEVVGLFGIAAGRQFELVDRMFGRQGTYTYSLGGRRVTLQAPHEAICAGVHLVPADRETDGLISGMSAADTVFLPWFRAGVRKGWWITKGQDARRYAEIRNTLKAVGPDGDAPIDEFSGGNRQKHLIARWAFVQKPKLLLLAQPTQGVDVGARSDIARAIRGLAAAGTTVIVASSESDEIDLLCDRAFVMVDTGLARVDRDEGFGEKLLTSLLELSEKLGKCDSCEHESH